MLLKRLKKRAKVLHEKGESNPWPTPRVKIEREPHFFFVITQPYTGSTALAHVLNSARGAALLHPTGEGQWLVPGMCDETRWNPSKVMNWESIRATWLKRVMTLNSERHVELVIEKSPPNILRIDQLIKVFPNHSLTAFNRDPFAHCASVLVRHHDPGSKTESEREEVVRKLATGWLDRSRWVRRWVQELKVVYFSYEEFCANPEDCIAKLTTSTPAFKTVNVDHTFQIKDYESQKLANQNARQIAVLSQREIDAISEQLRGDPALVQFFGYDVVMRRGVDT